MTTAERDTSSAISETTASSSGLCNCDISIFCNKAVYSQVHEVEKILLEEAQFTTAVSFRDAPSGRSSLENLFSIAKHSRIRVFLITQKFLEEDFQIHRRILENAKICSRQNSLLLLHKREYYQRIPDHLGDLKHTFLDVRISADEIAKEIIDFHNSMGFEIKSVSDPDTSKSGDSDYAHVNRYPKQKEKQEEEHAHFLEIFGNITRKRCYILISSPIRDHSPSLSHVSCVPWIRVFDFDGKSDTEGLFLWVKDDLSKRNLIKTPNANQIEALNDDTINWISITTNSGESVDRQKRDCIVSEHTILLHGESLADFCVMRRIPVILVLWYPTNSNLDNSLDDFLTGIRHHLKGRLDSFECIVCLERIPNKRTQLYRTFDRLRILENIIAAPVGTVCGWMKESAEGRNQTTVEVSHFSKSLPKFPEELEEREASVDIAEEDLSWIRSHLYILPKTNLKRSKIATAASEALSTLALSFLKGCGIHWDILETGGYDVDRDLLEDVKEFIETKHIATGRPGLITIYHSPGGGGTTFGRRLLHELRNQVPCGELVSERFSLKYLEERLIYLRNLTYLPTAILLDGNSKHDVDKILKMGARVRVILIHVRRNIHETGVTSDNKFFLKDRVSPQESPKFATVYSTAAPEKAKKLARLSNNKKSERPHVFEYGMTAFNSQFEGVRRYVHGYLQIHRGDEPLNWHKVLVFLSLANFYGHRGLPCKLFSRLLEKSENELIYLEDLPPSAQQFITEDEDNWKITHYVVSKLIIEQVLVRRQTTDYHSQDNVLTKEACRKLCKWAFLFIDNVTEYVGVCNKVVSHVHEILTSVFIRRNYSDPGEDENADRKTHFSKIIEEIRNPQEQESVFQKLVDSFPGQAEFRAHFGRFYSKQQRFEDAKKCFKQAIDVRKQELRGTDFGYTSPQYVLKPDDVMQRIFNMSGYACISHIRSLIGVHMGSLSPRKLKGKNLPELIRSCLQQAEEAISNFQNGRQYYQRTSNPSFANIGELKVRLQLSELAKHVDNDNFTELQKRPSPYCELANFALQSFHECDRLLAECISDRSRDFDNPEQEIQFCFNNFNYFFNNATEALKRWAGNDDNLHSMKCRLSLLKRKLNPGGRPTIGRRHGKSSEDSLACDDDIRAIVNLYEKISDSVFTNGSGTRISGYMMEWLKTIRHPCVAMSYSQTDVLARVEKWAERKERGSLALLYRYILNTVISLSLPEQSIETASFYAEQADNVKSSILQRDTMPIYAPDVTEWLGNSSNQNFARLIHSSELGEWNGKFWTDHDRIAKLQVCSGSIRFCRPHDGYIELDGNRQVKITVFFVPNRYEIGPSHSKKGTRVEFYIAFNSRRLAEAYEVTLLKSFRCQNPMCRKPTEISTLGKDPSEQCAICNHCETVVYASGAVANH